MKRKKYLRSLGETVLDQLRILHSSYDDTGTIRNVMSLLFGRPTNCLICGAPLRWEGSPPNDVDPWFCSKHCPICYDDETLFPS